MNLRLSEKLLDIRPHFDKTGRDTMDQFQSWMEDLVPSLGRERTSRDQDVQRAMEALFRAGPQRVTPIRMSRTRTMSYARDLAKKGL